ncbi:ABC transporter ATP-binding protein [Butyrivibrio sp. MC2013]|uniref:ABC transporter ATP-binding protein n=1 Tax=Butyrivibrio sp. MC2013 TaxID=1280686 RepID=UPI0003F5C648|nr:ABC transporter ATP-binding protein [Butyrivibrio sp. MC2013]
MIGKLNYIITGKEKRALVWIAFMIIVASVLELLGVTLFMPFIDVMLDTSKIHSNQYLDLIYRWGGFTGERTFLTAIAVAIMVVYIVKNTFMLIENDIIYRYAYKMQKRISVRLLTTYIHEPYTFHLNTNIAVLQRSLQEDTDLFIKGIIHILQLIAELVISLVMIIYLFKVSQSITVILGIILVLLLVVFRKIAHSASITNGKKGQKYKGILYQTMNQALSGIKEVKVLGRERFFIGQYEGVFGGYTDVLRKQRLTGIAPKYLVEAACMTGMLAGVIVKINFGQKDLTAFVGQLAVFAVAALRLLPSVGRINEHYTNIMYSSASFDLIYNDLKSIEDYEESKEEAVCDESWRLKDQIEIRHISYHYPDSEENVINDASLVIPKGHTVAFIGGSGSGKTTMADIILGLLKPQIGHIYADDMDIESNMKTWQHNMGYIPQVIYLSDDSIRNNIAFGIRPEAIDEDALNKAVDDAQLREFVDTLPDGLDTMVGDRGVRLSGGQRQRIGIARALYHNPEVLILDEATSALDNETETAVMKSIDSLKGLKTMIIIAHRLTTIRNADKIYEIENGKAVERSHKEVFKEL